MVIRPRYQWVIVLLSLVVVDGVAQPKRSETPPHKESVERTAQAGADQSAKIVDRAQSALKAAKDKPARTAAGVQRARALSLKVLNADDPRVLKSAALRRQQSRERLRAVPLTQPLTAKQLRTTSCPLFLSNFDHKLNALKTRYTQHPEASQVAAGYAAQLYARGQMFGDLNTVARALAIVERTLRSNPKAFKLRLLRAQISSTLHQVEITARELAWARAQADQSPRLPASLLKRVHAMHEKLELELGKDIEAHLKDMERGYRALSFEGFVRAARARELRGQFSLAQRYYGQAERHFTDVAPIPLAWLNVQRGLMAMHSGDFKSAHTFFLAAYERCPQYPMAAEHLAEIEGRFGHFDRSVALYRAVIKQTQNPEFMAALAELLLEHKMNDEARALIAQARARFSDLAQRFPEAMSGHAADFYLGIGGDPARGVALLRRNYKLRSNVKAAQALAAALIDTGAIAEATPLVKLCLKSPVEFAEKYWTAARLASARGQRAQALQYRDRALKLNPRIAEFEGALKLKPQGASTPSP